MKILTLLLLLLFMVFLVFIFTRIKHISGTKFMLLGLSITLIGGIIVVDDHSNLEGLEYLIVFIGLIVSLIGFGKNN